MPLYLQILFQSHSSDKSVQVSELTLIIEIDGIGGIFEGSINQPFFSEEDGLKQTFATSGLKG